MVEVERFDISRVPDHRRPRVMEMRSREGTLSVHCSRDDGSLWLFAKGLAGGDRAQVAVGLRVAGRLAEWLDGDHEHGFAYGGGGMFALRSSWPGVQLAEGERLLMVWGGPGPRQRLRMRLDDAACDELLICLRSWASAAAARMPADPS